MQAYVASPPSPMRLRPDTGASTPGGSRSGSKLGAREGVGSVEDSCSGLESVMRPELAAFFQRLNKVGLGQLERVAGEGELGLGI